jgi:hypothetical protein
MMPNDVVDGGFRNAAMIDDRDYVGYGAEPPDP